MKSSLLPLLLSLIAIFTFAGCQQDDVVSSRKAAPKPTFQTQEQADQYNAKMAEMPTPAENLISSRAPISYVATLLNGTYPYTHAVAGDIGNPATHDYFRFYANGGDNVTLGVTRISCGMDPSTYRYPGLYTDTDNLPGGVFYDDNNPDPCNSCFGDPLDIFVASTGWYTVGVNDFISCDAPPFDYEIYISGLSNFIIIGGCHTTVLNGQHNASTTMQQAIDNCLANSATSAAFVACVTALTNTWVSQGKITRAQKSKIVTCAQSVPF